MLTEHVRHWVAELVAARGAEPVALTAGTALSLSFEEGLDCLIEVDTELDLLHLAADLCQADGANKATLLEQAMTLNLYTRATGGATLGLDADRQTVILSLARSGQGLDEALFYAVLMRFVETALHLRRELASGSTDLQDPPGYLESGAPLVYWRG